jgi:hemerythrin
MAVIEWSEDLSVGVPVLDGHHQRLLELLNALFEAIRGPNSQETVGTVLGELADYTHYHFNEEERLLEQANFPNLAGHIKLHRAMTAKVDHLREEYRQDPRTVYAAELFEFLSDWLVRHIKSEDATYRPTLAG